MICKDSKEQKPYQVLLVSIKITHKRASIKQNKAGSWTRRHDRPVRKEKRQRQQQQGLILYQHEYYLQLLRFRVQSQPPGSHNDLPNNKYKQTSGRKASILTGHLLKVLSFFFFRASFRLGSSHKGCPRRMNLARLHAAGNPMQFVLRRRCRFSEQFHTHGS